jgi:hypothetical protein
MGKDSEKHLVGQPIFKQIIDLLPRDKFEELVTKYDSDKYHKRFSSWIELVSLLFGVLSRCDSNGEICAGMEGLQGKLNYLGFDSAPVKSTFGDGLRDRKNDLFKDFYFALLTHFSSLCRSAQWKESLLTSFIYLITLP